MKMKPSAAILALVVAAVGGISTPAVAEDRVAAFSEDFVCGPRCIQYVLDWHDMAQPELVELVREMQWPDMRQGSSFADISGALEQRGIYTRAVRLPAGWQLDWQGPAIVHVESGQGKGHFVVWLPSSSGDRLAIWDGLHGERAVSADASRRSWSGAVLLTSNAPIPGDVKCARARDRWLSWLIGAAILGLLVARPWKMFGKRDPSSVFLRGVP